MRRSDWNQVNGFAVHIHVHRTAHPIGHDRNAGRIPRRRRVAVRRARRVDHPLTQFFPREDRDAHLAERRVAAGVVAVDVCIDKKSNRRGTDAFDGSRDLLGELRVLGIDHQDPVRAGQHAHSASGRVLMARVETRRTGQHVKVRRDLVRRDVDLAVIGSLRPHVDGESCRRQSG